MPRAGGFAVRGAESILSRGRSYGRGDASAAPAAEVMRKVRISFVCVATLLLAAGAARAKEWRGVVPLHSTRADVERILGRPQSDYWHYEFEEERAHVTYSGGPCEEGLPGGWNVPQETVVEIYTVPKKGLRLSDVPVPGRDYRKVRAAHTQHVYYVDADEGVRYAALGDEVQSISYLPSAKDRPLSCGEYKYASPVAEGAKLGSVEQYPLDTYGDIPFEDAKARLDNFVIELQMLRARDRKWRGYIVVYAGRSAHEGEAQFKADCARNYLVKVRGMDADALVAADGGHRDEMLVELYITPADVYPPLLMPTVSPKKVEILPGKLRSCEQRRVP